MAIIVADVVSAWPSVQSLLTQLLLLSPLPAARPSQRTQVVADNLPIFNGSLQKLVQRVVGGGVVFAVGRVPAVDRRPWLNGVVSDHAATRMHQLQFLKLEKVIMKGCPTLVHEDHVDTCLAVLLTQSWDQVLNLPNPALHYMRESSNVNDMPGNACMDRVNLHGGYAITSLKPGVFKENRAICIALLV